MNRILLPALVSMLAVGCGKAAVRTHAQAPEKHPQIEAPSPLAKAAEEAVDETPTNPKPREVGDYVVYRFSGSFKKAPVTLTERVVAREKEAVTIDFILEDGQKKQELRVRTSEAGDVLSVSRIEKGKLVPSTVDEYEDLMSKTMLTADDNEGLVGTEDITVELGGDALPAKSTTFRVKIGEKSATLRTVVSEKFPWGDVVGEIAAEDGQVLYRAEVVSVGHIVESKSGAEPEVARSDYDDYE